MKSQATEPAQEKIHRRSIRLLHRFLRPYSVMIVVLALANLFPGFLLGLRPLVLAPALGKVLPSEVPPAESIRDITLDNVGPTLQNWIGAAGENLGAVFLLAALSYLFLTVIVALTSGLVNISALAVRMRMYKDMIASLHGHMLGLHLGFFTHKKTGELVSRFTLDLAKTATSIDMVAMGLIQSASQIAICAFILLRTEPALSSVVLLTGSVHFMTTRLLGGWVRRRTAVAYSGQAELSAALQESFQNIHVIKSFAAEGYDAERVGGAAEYLRKNFFRYMLSQYLEQPIRLLTDGLVAAAILWLCYYAIAESKLTMAGMALFFYMSTQLVLPMSEFGKRALTFYSLQGGLAHILDIFETKSEIRDGLSKATGLEKKIVLHDVSFGYEEEPPVVQGVNCEINRGETVAIVGPSGVGKSTLTHLILRLYDPTSGMITLDGKDIKEFTQDSYRRQFGVVTQECLLFNMTIRENIILGRPYTVDNLHRACAIANIDGFIEQLPDKYDTQVGDRGIRLSGGERQRIAIARAVYGRPQILIMDEATSALDTESERTVQKAIDRAVEGLTAIIVAHRLSTIAHADKIVVLTDGRVEAIGTHGELMDRSPAYRRLYEHQFAI